MIAAPLLAAALVATIALVTDLRHRRVPNWLTGTGVLLGVVLNVGTGGLDGGVTALAGTVVGFLILFPFYVIRAMGAGDVKLLAALGALLGPQQILSVAVYGGVVGGLMSVVLMASRGYFITALRDVLVLRVLPAKSGLKAPYAVALAAGVYLAMILPSIVR